MRVVFIFSLFLVLNNAKTQEIKTDISYKYMFANRWDKAIQNYNFSRPFLNEKQPLLMHGLNGSTTYIFNSLKSLNHGINLSYSYFKSSAENENLNNNLILHFLNLGYVIHYEYNKKLYSDLIISGVLCGLFRNINDEPFEYDEIRSKAYGFGGDLSIRTGYYLKLKNKTYLSPFVLVAYSPYVYSPNHEAVINQTKGFVSKNWTGIFTSQIGFSFHFKQ